MAAKSPFEIIEGCTTQNQLQTMMEHAAREKRDDVWRAAFSRLCELAGKVHDIDLEKDFYATLAAYEELLRQKHGHNQPAAYTRRKLANKGAIQCLEDWAVDAKETDGFKLLIEKGMPELTGEYIVLKHPKHFSPKALESARLKLGKYGVAIA